VIATKRWHLALACMLGAGPAAAQTSNLQDLQNKLLQFEESTQKAIAEMKAQIAVLEQAQKPPDAKPPGKPAPQTSEVPVVHSPVDYYGTETRTRDTAAENELGAPRIANEPLDPELRGFFIFQVQTLT
jgi:hypothetical protein